jgi:hypothetical protein
MKISKLLLSLLLLTTLVTGSLLAGQSARFVTGEQLFALLNSGDLEQQAAAKFYVLGAIDTASLLRDPKICVTPDTQSALLTNKLLEMLSERPELRRYNAASLVREILAQDFPCT